MKTKWLYIPIVLGVLGIIASVALIGWQRLFVKKTYSKKYEGSACVIKKLYPAHYPQNYILIFRNQKGGEFYTANKEIYGAMNEGDCVHYKYTEFIEGDEGKGKNTIDFEYEFSQPSAKDKGTSV